MQYFLQTITKCNLLPKKKNKKTRKTAQYGQKEGQIYQPDDLLKVLSCIFKPLTLATFITRERCGEVRHTFLA